MEQGKERVYMNIALSQEAAKRELEYARDHDNVQTNSLVREVSEVLLRANLTPLQAQAVLVRAWARVQAKGRISPDVEATEFWR